MHFVPGGDPTRRARGRRGPVAALLASLVLALPAAAQVPILNPGLPERETAVYVRRTGDRVETLTSTLALKEEGGRRYYEYLSSAPESVTAARFDAADLFARHVETTTRSGGASIRRVTTILESTATASAGSVLLAGFDTMAVSLRGFPFERGKKARLEFAGGGQQATGGFALEFTVVGRETIAVGGKSWDCWKTQLGLGGIFAAFGKTTLWYAASPPNVLVRSEGAAGPPGSPEVLLELRTYTSSGAAWTAKP